MRTDQGLSDPWVPGLSLFARIQTPRKPSARSRALSEISSLLRRSDSARSGHATAPRPFSPPGDPVAREMKRAHDSSTIPPRSLAVRRAIRFLSAQHGRERVSSRDPPKDSARLVFRAHTRSARVDGEGQGCSAWWTERARAGSGTPDPQAPTERSGSAGPKRSEGFLGVAVPLTSTN
jgi:hypothetical protein